MLTKPRLERCLAPQTMREFLSGWAEVVAVIQRVKAASSGGALIQYPKIPQSVSESLAARVLIRENIFPTAKIISRGGGADLSVAERDRSVRVEVKGSGSAEFQTFGPKDYACDLLVWLRFGEAAQIGLSGVLRVTLFQRPAQTLGNLGTRVTYQVAEAAAQRRGSVPVSIECLLADLVADD